MIQQPWTVKRFLERYWDLGVAAFFALIAVSSLAADLFKPLNILNTPWAIPISFIVGYIGFLSIALYISERRRHYLPLRIRVRVSFILAILCGLFLAYRQFTLITNPQERILVAIAVDTGKGTPETRELMNKVWQEVSTEVSLQHREEVKVVQRKITVADTGAAERIMAQRKFDALIWVDCEETEDVLYLSVAANRLPRMVSDVLEVGEKHATRDSIMRDIHMVLAVREDPSEVVGQAMLSTIGLIYYHERKYDEAIAYFNEALDRALEECPHPFGHKALYHFLMLASCQIGDCVGALEYSEELVALEPDSCESLNLLARSHYRLGELDDAISVCQRVLDLDPANVEAYMLLASAHKAQDDFEKVEEYLKKVIEIEPENDEAHNNLGDLYSDRGDDEEAVAELKKAIEINPNNALAHANLGVLYEEQNDIVNAAREYRTALKIMPRSGYYHYLLGRACLKGVGYNAAAMEMVYSEFRKAISFDPALEVNTSTILGMTYMSWGRKEQGIQAFTRSIEVASEVRSSPRTLALAYTNRGQAYRESEDCERAIVDYNEAIELAPDSSVIAYYGLGYCYIDLQEYEKAITNLNKAIELAPDDGYTYYARGYYYYRMQEYEEAIADWSETVKLDPQNSLAYYMLGVVHKEKGERDKAIENLEKVLEIGNDEYWIEEAKKLLEELGEKESSTSRSHLGWLVVSSCQLGSIGISLGNIAT